MATIHQALARGSGTRGGRAPRPLLARTGWLGLLVGVALLAGCVDERIVYRDRPLFDDPPAGAAGFLGYSDPANHRTVCGNCHIGKQREWENTAHAFAWSSLAASGSARPFCEACHTVSSRGNLVTESEVGWVATGHARYQDVQCEACHGPGLDHVLNPDAPGNKPLAPLTAGTDLLMGCGECHAGSHRPFVEEWEASRHGQIRASPAGRAPCNACHEAKGALAAWGVKATFLEQDDAALIPLTCAVCHDPHDARHGGQLRFPIDQPSVEVNLCMKCHQQRGEPDLASTRGPHSPEGPLLLGTAGWWPPNLEYDPGSIVGTHGSEANPRLCAGCHVQDYQIRDPVTDEFVFRATGHSFEAIPCLDGDGLPVPGETCAIAERSFRSCTGCHGSETAARSAYIAATMDIDRLAGDLEAVLDLVPASEFEFTNVYTTAMGAAFNLALARVRGSAVHNPFLIKALLIASIRQVELDYGVAASTGQSLEARLITR